MVFIFKKFKKKFFVLLLINALFFSSICSVYSLDSLESSVENNISQTNQTSKVESEYLIPDLQLRMIINSKLGKKGEDLKTYSASLEELENLTISLDFSWNQNIYPNINPLESYIQFESLEGLEYLKNVKNIRFLRTIIPTDGIENISKMASLEDLNINSSFFDGEDATTAVLNIGINGRQIEDKKIIPISNKVDLGPIANLNNLKSFKFNINGFQENSPYSYSLRTNFSLSGLSKAVNLKELELSYLADVDDRNFEWITSLAKLTRLSITDSPLESVESISKLQNLTNLNINATYVTDFSPIIDKDYFKGASYMKYRFNTQYFENIAENGENLKVIDLDHTFNFGKGSITNFTTMQNYLGSFNIYNYKFTDNGLSVSLKLNERKEINAYNYVTGKWEDKTLGIVFGFNGTTEDGKQISYLPIIVPIGNKITFDSNYENGPKEVVNVEPLNKVIPVKMTRSAYTLEGWYTDKETTSPFDFKTDVNDNLILYAKWKKQTGGGGGGTVDPPVNPPVPSKTVILASGEKYTDVLTATVLGNEKNAPILLTQKDKVDDKTLAELKRLSAEYIIISGGVDSVSQKVVEQLKSYNVTRIAGTDRYETASKIGAEVRKTGNKTGAMLVDGTNFPDVIAISSLASQKRVPILLTEPKTLNNTTQDTLKSWGVNDVIIGGGYNSVSRDIENNLGISKVSRFGGEDRYETAGLIGSEVRELTGNDDDMILVDGTNFPDGITINSLATNFKSPIMLTEPEHLNHVTDEKIKEWSIKNILIGGGYNSVSQDIENKLGVNRKERVFGQDRYETAVKISQRLSQGNIAKGSK
ncbi:cell wall-binding repeat-containing protein [Clostridioides mangenotii]|uniref:cell wall-binding repeat-containing protein n=1 Tax=Metaclostridioides mangenotii TaxID=1540 RepID=UPI001C103977|nr:cell wall-binding repeat-containing protein [Clostridioides mangenotii]MBU5307473.1 cell wall-binding repeat-containing protein [Clostridioides mangenotii]